MSFDERFGIKFTGEGWNAATKAAVRQAVFETGMAFARGHTGTTFAQAFSQVYVDGMEFEWNTKDKRYRSDEQNAACGDDFTSDGCKAYGGFTISGSHIMFASMSGVSTNQPWRSVKNVLHELGHAYHNITGSDLPSEAMVANRNQILRPNATKDGPADWQQNWWTTDGGRFSEMFADMFIAYVYGAWNENSENVMLVNEAQTWMNGQMP